MSNSSNTPHVPLFDRLPEIYQTRDAEQSPPDQLRAYLAAVEYVFGKLNENIGQLYEDLFIDTCDDWVIPYLADLLGTSHLKGDPRTLRADVADTIALRRRKGTLGAIERLAVNLTSWACRAVELRENLGWLQHLNHQRPDTGGVPPYSTAGLTRFIVPRGGTVPLRDPAALALLGTPFDNFAYTADVKPALDNTRHINLPNLAIFLWRLAAYRLQPGLPLAKGVTELTPKLVGLARFALRFDLHPLDLPVRLINTSGPGFRRAETTGGIVAPLTQADAVPGPILDARLTSDSPEGHPESYVVVDFFNELASPPRGFDLGDAGLHLFMPQSLEPLLIPPPSQTEWRWIFRGDNLCDWEAGLRRPLRYGEIIIDPDIGRVLIGMDTEVQRDLLIRPYGAGFASGMYVSYTYGSVGPVGAHPVTRVYPPVSTRFELRKVGAIAGGESLQTALEGLDTASQPVVIEIHDSLVHRIDLSALVGTAIDGGVSLRLAQSLTIRATEEHRPIILLAQPLAFRPVSAATATTETPTVRLEGLYLAPDEAIPFPVDAPLIARAAVARLEIIACTLTPGGYALRDGNRADRINGMRLANGYGFADPGEEDTFLPTPDIIIKLSITGSLSIDERYHLDIKDSIIDASPRGGDAPGSVYAIAAATDPTNAWAARLDFEGLTCFGATRVAAVGGSGGIFTQRFEVLDNQHGCIKRSWFSGNGDRLPPSHFCLDGREARLVLTSQWFNNPGYAQIARESDPRIQTFGPNDDVMGAFGFLLEAHKWINLQVRLREFMPVGVRPLILPVT